MNNNPTNRLIHLTIDDHVDPFGNSEVPSPNEERLLEDHDNDDSGNRNKNDKKTYNNNSSNGKEKEKKNIAMLIGVALLSIERVTICRRKLVNMIFVKILGATAQCISYKRTI